mmetsp:Transcript_31885/g.75758  ORF Transcript_31885/g.75758 Transcript_31885/m.75758 type:complete len:217 (+) Transcript_31885:3-653(+)
MGMLRHRRDFLAQRVAEMLRDNVLIAERCLLYTLGFNFRIEKPYEHITKRALRFTKLDGEALRFLTQVAWNFVNDSLQTTLLLEHEPRDIAYGAIYLAAKFLGISLPDEDGLPWFARDGVDLRPLEDITGRLLEICERNAERAITRKRESAEEPDGGQEPPQRGGGGAGTSLGGGAPGGTRPSKRAKASADRQERADGREREHCRTPNLEATHPAQ